MFNRVHGAAVTFVLVTTLFCARSAIAEAVMLTVGNIEAQPEAEVDVTVSARDCQGLGGLQFHLRYDPTVLEWSEAQLHSDAGPGLLDAKVVQPGQVRIALVAQEPVTEDGPLVTATFKAVGEAGADSAVELEAARAWTQEDILELHVQTNAGAVQIARPALPMQWIAIGAGVVVVVIAVALLRRRR